MRALFAIVAVVQLVALAGSQSTGGVVVVAIEIMLISILYFY